MKRIIFSIGLFVMIASCQRPQESVVGKVPARSEARSVQACSYVTLSGNITSNTTLSAANIYKISGIVVVKSPATLTIPAGTVLMGIKSALTPAFLVVEKGAKLVATGTSVAPIIFTSDQGGSSAPGDWGGIAYAGQANNNNSNSLDVHLSSSYTLTGGGTTNTDNSGNLQYVQLHFAGAGYASDDLSKSALILNSVGTGTAIDHVQVTNSGYDGVGIYGGVVPLANIVSYKEGRTDFPVSFGYRGNMQFLASMRLDNGATPTGSSACGIEVTNNKFTSTATPLTQPIISNITVMGPNQCSNNAVNANFLAAIRITGNAEGKVYNTVLSSWNASSSSGLRIDDANSIAHTATNDLEFSYNSFDNSGSTPYTTGGTLTWSGGCSATMAAWINGTGTISCRESGNQFSVTTLGYDASFCDDFCGGGFSQNFVLGTTTLASPNFTWDTGSSFSHVSYRGAFGATDFTAGWTQWCPQSVTYCM